MRVYLDNCSIQRPLDDRSQLRIALESECVLSLLALIEAGNLTLVSSDALVFEVQRNPNRERRLFALRVIALAGQHIRFTKAIRERAAALMEHGLTALDALHIACAEHAGVDVFCTTDDGIIAKARRIPGIHLSAMTPTELVKEVES